MRRNIEAQIPKLTKKEKTQIKEIGRDKGM